MDEMPVEPKGVRRSPSVRPGSPVQDPKTMLPNAVHESPSDLLRRALDAYERPLLAYANSILNDVEGARDAVQDTFLKLYQQPSGSVGSALKSWLFTVCRNRCYDMLRKRRRLSDMDLDELDPVDDRSPDPVFNARREEAVGDVMRLIERLSENQREVLRLKFQQGLSYKEISKVTGLSVTNVGFLLHTAIKRLRGMLSHRPEF